MRDIQTTEYRQAELNTDLTQKQTKFPSNQKHLLAVYTMASIKSELNDLFAIPPITELPLDILGELQSILRLHSVSPQELSYKWESYTLKMGSDQTKLDLTTVRAFKVDIQELLEREARGKAHVRSVDKRAAFVTPRNAGKGGDVFGM